MDTEFHGHNNHFVDNGTLSHSIALCSFVVHHCSPYPHPVTRYGVHSTEDGPLKKPRLLPKRRDPRTTEPVYGSCQF